MLTVSGKDKSSSGCLLGEAVAGWPGLISHGAVRVSIQSWQEGENHKTPYQLTAIAIDLSSFLSCRISAMSPDSPAGNDISKLAWRTSGSLVGGWGAVGVRTGAMLIRLAQLRASRVTSQPCSLSTGRKLT